MQDKLQKFRLQFNEETRERIGVINNLALSLEQDASRSDLVEQLKREMHTIKGGSRILGLRSISHLAHFFEDFFIQVMSGSRTLPAGMADRLFRALDLMQEMLELDESESLFQRVEDFLRQFQSESHPPGGGGPGSSQDRMKQMLKDKLKSRLQGAKPAVAAVPAEAAETGAAAEGPLSGGERPAESAPPAPGPAGTAPPESAAASSSAGEGRENAPASERKQSFSKSFRIDSDLIDTISDGALQLKVMTSFFNIFLSEYTGLSQSVARLQEDLLAATQGLAGSPAAEKVETVQMHLRDLARSSQEKKKLISTRVVSYQHYFDTLFRHIEDLKLIPLATIFSVFPRFVRDYSQRNEKEIFFDHSGGATRLDKRIAEAVNDSLVHLLRNAVDHGIEAPEDRLRLGKPRAGKILLSAATQGDRVAIVIQDDGKGFDPEQIRESAVRKKLVTAEEAARLSAEEVIQFVFTPGFSTAPIITDTSGRGVGMDVVLHAVNDFNGTIRIDSDPGRGSTIRMTLPISVSTTRILHVRDGENVVAIPADPILEVKKVHLSDMTRRGNIHFYLEKGVSLPAATVSTVLGGQGDAPQTRDAKIMLIVQVEKNRFGLMVDQTLHEENAILHRKDPFIQGIPYIVGITVSILGEPFLVLDAYGLHKFFQSPERAQVARPAAARARSVQKTVLLVEDSVVTREMEKAIIESAGYRVVEAVNGEDGLEKLGGHAVDCVVSDVEMPLMDGFTMTEQIRAIPRHKDLPIVIVTTRENREDKIRGIQVGANAYITKKDFDQMKLLETIQRLI